MHRWDDNHTATVFSFLNRDGDFFTSDRLKLLLPFLMPPETSQIDVVAISTHDMESETAFSRKDSYAHYLSYDTLISSVAIL